MKEILMPASERLIIEDESAKKNEQGNHALLADNSSLSGAPLIRVLLAEDNPGDARLLREALAEAEGARFHLTHVERLADAFARLSEDCFDVILLDLSLADSQGLETLIGAHEHAPGVPIVVLTGLDDEAMATQSLQSGAQDYLLKGQRTAVL